LRLTCIYGDMPLPVVADANVHGKWVSHHPGRRQRPASHQRERLTVTWPDCSPDRLCRECWHCRREIVAKRPALLDRP
jgi:hypothetical protein